MGASLTPDEIHTARLMRRECKTVEEIARHLGRSRTLIGEACKGFTLNRMMQQQIESVKIPEHVQAERERRLSLQPRNLTAAIAGDPLPGMSALEQRQRRKPPPSSRVRAKFISQKSRTMNRMTD